MAEGHLEVPHGCPWPWATVKFYTFYFSLSFTLYLAPALPARPCPLPCPARQTDRRTLTCPLPCLAARFSESRFPNPTVRAESGFSNPTVRAGSTTSIKTRNRCRTDRRTDTILALIYKITCAYYHGLWRVWGRSWPGGILRTLQFSFFFPYFFHMLFVPH
jgi:hypothetical protein